MGRKSPHFTQSTTHHSTTHHVRELLPPFLDHLNKRYHDRPDMILAAWPECIGKDLAPHTEAVAFHEGVLTVKVKNSTLYSLLNQYDKPRLVKSLRTKFPKTLIKTIIFRLG